jgi:hypothetical protein
MTRCNSAKGDDVKSQSRNSTERTQGVPQEVETMHAQIEGRCYCCGEKGHVSPDCPKKSKTNSELYFNKMNKGQQHHQQNKASQNGTTTSNKTTNEDHASEYEIATARKMQYYGFQDH